MAILVERRWSDAAPCACRNAHRTRRDQSPAVARPTRDRARNGFRDVEQVGHGIGRCFRGVGRNGPSVLWNGHPGVPAGVDDRGRAGGWHPTFAALGHGPARGECHRHARCVGRLQRQPDGRGAAWSSHHAGPVVVGDAVPVCPRDAPDLRRASCARGGIRPPCLDQHRLVGVLRGPGRVARFVAASPLLDIMLLIGQAGRRKPSHRGRQVSGQSNGLNRPQT